MSPVVQGPTGSAWLDRINGLEAEIARLKDEASDLVDAGDDLARWIMAAPGYKILSVEERMLKIQELWRHCPARAPHRRWKRETT